MSSGGGAAGIDLAAMWASLTNNPADAYASTKIAAAHIPDMAYTYGYLKSGDVSGVYLPLTGGTMSNTNLVTNLNADLLDGHHEHEFVANNRGLINNFNSAYGSSVHFIDPNYTNGPSGVEYGQALVLHADGDTTAQLVFPLSRTTAFLRVGKENGTVWQSWREFAFLDSNVASATRLQTAQLIWGQSFDGSSDISGSISVKDEAGYYHFDNDGVTLYCYIGHDSNLQGSWFYNGISGQNIRLYDTGGCEITAPLTCDSTLSVASCIFSGAKQSSTSISTIPADSAVALRTGDGSATGSNTWVWRLNWAYANYGIFWEDNSDVLYFVGDGNSRFNIDFSAGHAQASGSLLAGGSIYLTQGASSAATGYVSAGGGYSQNSGKYGVKIIACDQSDIQSGLGQDCMGDLPYDFSVVGGKSWGYGYISFVFHDVNSTTYSRAGYFNQYGDLNVTRNIDSAGTIHSSTGIWSEGYVSAGGLASSSDERLKSGIKDFGYSAEMLMALRPREWDWNEKSYMKGHAAGVVAQELQQVMPYAIVERQYLSVNYDMLHGLEIAGLQDHEMRIRQLERENAELKRRLNMN